MKYKAKERLFNAVKNYKDYPKQFAGYIPITDTKWNDICDEYFAAFDEAEKVGLTEQEQSDIVKSVA